MSGSGQKERGVNSNGTRVPPKPLFSEDEKVLCYEPDQKKAQVLYDSKVMGVVQKKDSHGKVHFEYKIHFQGWKSSWDRHVREDNVLKDTDENRNLQRDLNLQAQLLSKTALKKKRKTIMEKLKAVSMNGRESASSSISFYSSRGENNTHQSSGTEKETTDQESSDDEEGCVSYQIFIPDELKQILENDAVFMKKKMLTVLPPRWNVAELLEEYILHVARKEINAYVSNRAKFTTVSSATAAKASASASTQLGGKLSVLSTSKTSNSSRSVYDAVNEELIKTFQRINLTKRIVEDIRIMFDFMLSHILLYQHEREQYNEFRRGCYNRPNREVPMPNPMIDHGASDSGFDTEDERPSKRRKTGEQNRADIQELPSPCKSKTSVQSGYKCELQNKCEFPWACEQLNDFMDELMIYQLLPRELEESNDYPSLCYGFTHLLRLFVKLPEILSKSSIPRKKLRTIVAQINKMAEFFRIFLQKIVSERDYFRPKINTKLYEEDFFNEKLRQNLQKIQHVVPATVTSETPSHQGKGTLKEVLLSKAWKVPTRSSPNQGIIKNQVPTTRRKTLIADESGSSIPLAVKNEEGKRLERTVTRNQRRGTTGKLMESAMIDGNALGVRKSLSIEELSRETLVAANNPDLKQYSLRMQCRIPYK